MAGRWTRIGTVALAVCAATVCAVSSQAFSQPSGHRSARHAPAVDRAAARPHTHPSPSVPTAAPAPATASRPDLADAVRAAVSALTERADGHVSVAILDMDTGQSADAGDAHRFVTASVVKVDILATLLLQAQRAGRDLDPQERSWARAMIRISDNAAADALWRSVGGARAVAKANEAFGMTETVPGTGGRWGLTQTTAADQLRLLRAVFEAGAPLDAESQDYAQELMGSVAGGQDWGVSAAAAGGDFALKNGWLPRSATGLWVVNSVGRIATRGGAYLIAVLSDDQRDRATGIGLVEDVARAAVRALNEQ